MQHTTIHTFEFFDYQNKEEVIVYKISNLKMGQKLPTPILEKEEAISRWNKNDLDELQNTFETFARINAKDKMSKSAFSNYVFPFLPKDLMERLFCLFQLQFIDNDLKSNYKRNIKIGAKYRTNSSIKPNIKQKEEKQDKEDDDSNDDNDTDKKAKNKKKKKKKKKKIPPSKVGKIPFLSFTVNWDQFLIGMTVIVHGSNKEKLSLLWRLFDITNSDNLSYYDMEDILNILLKLETNFYNQTADELLYSLFTFELPSNDPNDASKLTKINDNEYTTDNEEEENKLNENNHRNTEIEIQETGNSKSSNFDINELIECKMQDIKLKKTQSDTPTETKTDEKAELLKNDNMNTKKIEINDKTTKRSNRAQSNEELEELKEKLISFEHFYEWSKQFMDGNNPYTSWLCKTFPPPEIQPIPSNFIKLWQDLYINCDKSIHDKYGYLCTDNNEIYTVSQNTKC